VPLRWSALLAALACALPAQRPIEELVAELGSEDNQVRVRAYQELQRRRDAAIVKELEGRIERFERSGQQYAIYLLRSLPLEATQQLYRRLAKQSPPFLRVAASAELVRKGDRSAMQQLIAVLGEVPEQDRIAVTNHLYSLDGDAYHRAVLQWLHPGASAGVVRALLLHLERQGKVDEAQLRAALTPLAEHDDVDTRAAALAWLARVDRAHAEALATLLVEDERRFWPVRDLLDTDRKLGNKLVEVMAAALRAPRSAYDVTKVAKMMQKQVRGLAVSPLRELLDHEKEGVRGAALEALAKIPGALNDGDLRRMLGGDDVKSALVAADLLRRRDDPSGLDVVLALLPKAGKHKADAAEVLAGFRDRRAAEPLLELLDDRDVQVRRRAWTGMQALMRGLFPYRRFYFGDDAYRPDATSRAAAIAQLRAWWKSAAR